ncbi:ROK family protein [Anaerosacchariphilus polymeriproducens]|uniref:ROK family protein n=1 Tax=Anaerosacchariphilus polymeriproducens TaxID=1812858 RepID=A0A371B0A9_9FIRM|nr:ROK family protein [Anaerosacchariphilus polymeriproducens]RDU25257.1 ROK family protein [Anaerosacchariphilus polymeriproducens]
MMAKKGINQDIIQKTNRSLLLKYLRREGTCSRVHLANLTELKQATVTNIMKDFIDWEIVKEVGFLNGNKGRRSIGIAVNKDMFRVIGVRIARKYFKVALYDLTGELITEKRIELENETNRNASDIIEMVADSIKTIIIDNNNEKILAIGVALPGPFIAKKNRIGLITGTEGWNNVDVRQLLLERCGIPVFLEHDANAGAYAHMWGLKDAYKDEVLIYVAAGQGIGAGIIIEGEIFRGALGTSGEIGHMSIDRFGEKCACGNQGCLEKYASSTELVKKVNEELNLEVAVNFKQVKEWIENGDELCVNLYKESCRNLGRGIINLINILNPDIIIIGDEMTRPNPKIMQEEVSETVSKGILKELWKEIDLKVSQYNGDSILDGAAIMAINEVFNNPSIFLEKI